MTTSTPRHRAAAVLAAGALVAVGLSGCAAAPEFNGMTASHASKVAASIDDVVTEDFSEQVLGIPSSRFQKGAGGDSQWTVAASQRISDKYGDAIYLGLIPTKDVTPAIAAMIAKHKFDHLIEPLKPSE